MTMQQLFNLSMIKLRKQQRTKFKQKGRMNLERRSVDKQEKKEQRTKPLKNSRTRSICKLS
jgi:hypothetical protein